MSPLNELQQQRALEAMREFLAAPPRLDGKTPIQADEELDLKYNEEREEDLKRSKLRIKQSSIL